ncbi:MAG TPA: HAMP domain-containing sensor histidine kinase [Ktedonobacteraceae bacterium]|nr:HAMP domain-containing sensor histidine kinase [Ktedonobacteraceae bacterium]
MRTQQPEPRRRGSNGTHLLWWRRPFWGYLLALPLVALDMPVPMLLEYMRVREVFACAPDFLTTAFIVWMWGIGPAIVAIALDILELDFFFIPPYENLSWGLQKALPLLFFLLLQLGIIWLTIALESARRQALLAREELQQRTEELEEANRAKQRFLSMASHELKTPVTLILTEVQYALRKIARQKEPSPEIVALREVLEKVNQHIHYLQRLIADILDLSLLGAKAMPLAVGRCDVSATCRKIVDEQRTSSGRSIDLQAPPTPIILYADSERVGQVIGNLVTNAIKYSAPTRPITIRLSQSETTCCIQVHNYGHPIASQDQERIFEPFYRTSAAQASREEGSGLGLAISKEIVERHNGKIWVESSQEKGTTFFVQLPLKVPSL